ncbi:transcription initiation factor TFIID subunit A [Apiospora saccharicola]|uniref:Transcription initiation factor TFIID subunit A n=1 Tax=Apiospora saccharicola TaxID=335842 RepID=A0ABR1VMI4_9PEZI
MEALEKEKTNPCFYEQRYHAESAAGAEDPSTPGGGGAAAKKKTPAGGRKMKTGATATPANVEDGDDAEAEPSPAKKRKIEEEMRTLSVLNDQEKEKYEKGLRGLYDQMEKNGPETQLHQNAKQKIMEISRMVAQKISSCASMFESLHKTDEENEDEKLYFEVFEPVFLESSHAFYKNECDRLLPGCDILRCHPPKERLRNSMQGIVVTKESS